MAQISNQLLNVSATFANNIAYESGATETVALDNIPSLGLRNLSVFAVCSSGTISSVKLYGSPDGVHWVAVTGYTPFSVAAGNMNKAEATGVYMSLRVTCTGIGTVDVYCFASQS